MTNTSDDSLGDPRESVSEFTEHAAPICWTRYIALPAARECVIFIPLSSRIAKWSFLKVVSNRELKYVAQGIEKCWYKLEIN